MPTGTPTPNAGLNQWRLEDKPVMEDFNADNRNTDNAIGALQAELAAKADRSELDGKANLDDLAAKADRSELDAKANMADLAAKANVSDVAGLLERIEELEENGGGTNPGNAPLPSQSRITVTPGNASAEVTIENLGGAAYAGTKLVWKEGADMPESPTDGTVLDAGMQTEVTATGLTNDQSYTMRAFAYNAFGGAQTSVEGAVASFMPRGGILLSDLPVGSLIRTPIAGGTQNSILVHQGNPDPALYDASFDDSAIMLLENIYENNTWHSSNVNDYANSRVYADLNSRIIALFDEPMWSLIKTVKIPYRPGSGAAQTINSGTNGLSAKLWLLSEKEVGGGNHAYAVVDGVTLDYFAGIENGAVNAKRVAYLNGAAAYWWLRSPGTWATSLWGVYSGGEVNIYNGVSPSGSYNVTTNSWGIRPAFVIPQSALVDPTPNADGSYNMI